MYRYHGSQNHKDRLQIGHCRCGSDGPVYNLEDLTKGTVILDPEDGTPLCTPPVGATRSERPGNSGSRWRKFIFAVSVRHEVHVAPDGDRPTPGSVKHETLFHNEDVLAAGEVWINNGMLAALNDFSGSYQTDGELEVNPGFSEAILEAIEKRRLPMTDELLARLGHLRTS